VVSEDAGADDRDSVIDALFASDLARDVRGEFKARRDEGLSVHDATAAIVAHFRHLLDHPDDGPVVIIVMALLQLLEGAPTGPLRDAALGLLREGHGFATRRSEDQSLRSERARLRTQLITMLERAQVRAEGE
jgi:hypothetical protein